MTLILAVAGPESIWMLADRRLTLRGRPSKEDARKLTFLETTDGAAILGYAGLGATARGTEPADWMSNVLRGRSLTLEQSLKVLIRAMQDQFPRHMRGLPACLTAAHHVIVPAFVDNKPRLYTIDLVLSPDRKCHQYKFTHHLVRGKARVLGLGGTGGLYLNENRTWAPLVRRVVQANDCGQVTARAVADHLAALNNHVSQINLDGTVGPGCIVAWRYRKGGFHGGGGAQEFYLGTERQNGVALPTIANGMDVKALIEIIMPDMRAALGAMRKGKPFFTTDNDTLKAAVARLPHTPDENLD